MISCRPPAGDAGESFMATPAPLHRVAADETQRSRERGICKKGKDKRGLVGGGLRRERPLALESSSRYSVFEVHTNLAENIPS